MKRLALGIALLAALVALAGCSSVFGPGQPSESQLTKNATYDWDANATTSYLVNKTEFRGVVRVENKSWIKLYRKDELNNNEPLSVSAVRFRYPNGTVVTTNGSSLSVSVGGSKTNVTLPQAGGQLGFTANRPKAKRFSTPLFLDGKHSVEVTMPPGARVGVPLLSQVRPGSSDRWVENNRMTVRWDSTSRGPVVLRYYLARDLLIFGGIAGILVLVAVGGTVYYLRQIKVLERRREEMAPDVDYDDDDLDDGGPPPGMG